MGFVTSFVMLSLVTAVAVPARFADLIVASTTVLSLLPFVVMATPMAAVGGFIGNRLNKKRQN